VSTEHYLAANAWGESVNRELVLHHLAEAHQALTRMLQDAREDPEWGIGELVAEMPHLYHHINTAWNGRESSNAAGQASDTEFRQWSAFPVDLPMFQ
jgi:hypothetical protein